MQASEKPVRVLYSFPHKIGADRICTTAWQQVNGLAAAGAKVLLFPAAIHKKFSNDVEVKPTLARGNLRIPIKFLGRMRALRWHDYVVSRRLEKLEGQIDIVHVWPVGALATLKTAHRLGIPTVLERPNAHTRFAYEVVRAECEKLGMMMPQGHEHAFQRELLQIEEAEYQLADYLLCPSDFVAQTFVDVGFASGKLLRHQYGFDEQEFKTEGRARESSQGLKMLFVGGVAPRKGLHYALQAWLNSSAHSDGTFSIAGEFMPGYREKLAPLLAHPSIKLLGHRKDVNKLMRESDILILPSIEEGSALVTSEARGSGCVLLVSKASGAICTHMEDALVHNVGDIESLTEHISMLHKDFGLLETLRAQSLRTVGKITWTSAGVKLLEAYQRAIDAHSQNRSTNPTAA